jgi:phage terminase large subunit
VPVIQSIYKPRWYFRKFHTRRNRWAILVCHRRAGKTVAAVNDLIEKASYNTREAPRYAYIAPILKQAKAIAWEYLKRFAAPFNPKISESELYVELTALPNAPRITIYGADNPDSFRGMYFDGVVLDEFGNMVESVWKEVLLPALVDRRGWAVFMGTPNGPNHFRDLWYKRKKDDAWLTEMYTVEDTKVIAAEELAEMRKIMDPEEYEQEMMCNFEASVRGAIYARQMEQLIQGGRLGKFPLDFALPVDLVMDLGWKDNTTMGFFQPRFDGICVGHSHGDSLRKISVYIDYAKAFWKGSSYIPAPDSEIDEPVRAGRPYIEGKVYLPHDAKAKSLQTGKAIIDHFRKAKMRPRLVPDLDLIDGIAATRATFPHYYINESENETLVLALKTYHRKYDEKLQRHLDEPVHDWSSDWADMFRYMSIVANPAIKSAPKGSAAMSKGIPQTPAQATIAAAGGVHYGFCLEDLWELGR